MTRPPGWQAQVIDALLTAQQLGDTDGSGKPNVLSPRLIDMGSRAVTWFAFVLPVVFVDAFETSSPRRVRVPLLGKPRTLTSCLLRRNSASRMRLTLLPMRSPDVRGGRPARLPIEKVALG